MIDSSLCLVIYFLYQQQYFMVPPQADCVAITSSSRFHGNSIAPATEALLTLVAGMPRKTYATDQQKRTSNKFYIQTLISA